MEVTLGSPLEVRLVKSPRPLLAGVVEAARRGDAAGTRSALVAYDAVWNGIEVYVTTRSRPIYQEVEGGYQRKIEEMLRSPSPAMAEIVPLAEAMLAKYDEAIALSESGAALSPLFDEVAAIRLARAGLRGAVAALKQGDPAAARAAFTAFQAAWPGVQGLIEARSPEAAAETAAAIGRAGAAFATGSATAADLGPVVDGVVERYNAGLTLVVTEARATLG